MGRTVAIVLAAAVVGGLAGASVGVAVGGGHSHRRHRDRAARRHPHERRPQPLGSAPDVAGGDLHACRAGRRGDHCDADEAGAGDVLQPGVTRASDRSAPASSSTSGRHRHQRPRRPGRQRHPGRLLRRGDVLGEDRRRRPVDRSRRRSGCDAPASALEPLAFADSGARPGRGSRVCDRQPLRPRPDDDGRHRQRDGTRHHCAERPRHPERDPDGCTDQSRELGRPAPRCLGRRDRDQRSDRGRTVDGNVGVGFAIASNTAKAIIRAADRARPR